MAEAENENEVVGIKLSEECGAASAAIMRFVREELTEPEQAIYIFLTLYASGCVSTGTFHGASKESVAMLAQIATEFDFQWPLAVQIHRGNMNS